LKHFFRGEAVEFDHLVPRLVTTHQFDTTTGAIQPVSKQLNQCFVRRGVHGWRGDSDSQFGTDPVMRDDLVGGSARLQFHREQRSINLRAEKIGYRHDCCDFGNCKLYVVGIDEPEGERRERTRAKVGDEINPQVRHFGKVHDGDADGDSGIEGAAGNAAERKRHCR